LPLRTETHWIYPGSLSKGQLAELQYIGASGTSHQRSALSHFIPHRGDIHFQ
jgi:hypothetical protein